LVDLAAVHPARTASLRARLRGWLHDHPLEPTGGRLTRRRAAELQALRALGYVD